MSLRFEPTRIGVVVSDAVDVLRRRAIPFVPQFEFNDCGAACLAMSLAARGVTTSRAEVLERFDTRGEPVSARRLVEVARSYGVRASGVRATVTSLAELGPGTILLWEATHFVVLSRCTPGGLLILDPAFGRRVVTMRDAEAAFDGVCIRISGGPGRAPRRTRENSWRHLLPFLRTLGRTAAGVLAVSALLAVLGLALPLAIKSVVTTSTNGSVPSGPALAITALVAITAVAVLHMIRGHLIVSLEGRWDRALTIATISRLLSMPLPYLQHRSLGDLVARVRVSAAIRPVLSVQSAGVVVDGGISVILLALVFGLDAVSGLILGGLVFIQVAATFLAWQGQRYLGADAFQAQVQAQARLIDVLKGAETVKASGIEAAVAELWTERLDAEVRRRSSYERAMVFFDGINLAAAFAAPVLVLFAAYGRLEAGELDIGRLLAVVALAMGIVAPLRNVAASVLMFGAAQPSVILHSDVFDTEPESPPGARQLDRVTGRIEFRGVGFRYGGERPPVVSDVDLTIEPGEAVGIIGRSGSGKSTFAELLTSLRLPDSGAVLIDGHDTRDLDRSALRRQLGYVSQGATLFAETVRENVEIGGVESSAEDLAWALRTAGFDETLASLPMGLDTRLGLNGARLSGGQRQRLILARALLRRPRILVLDEATSALDPATESAVYERITGLGCTLVVISHRVSTVARLERVLVLQDGGLHELDRCTGDDPAEHLDRLAVLMGDVRDAVS